MKILLRKFLPAGGVALVPILLLLAVQLNGDSHAQGAVVIEFNDQPDGSGSSNQVDPAGPLYGTVTGLPENGTEYCVEEVGKTSGIHQDFSCDYQDLYWEDAVADPDWTYQNGEWQAVFDPVQDFFSGASYKVRFRNEGVGVTSQAGTFTVAATDETLGDNVCHTLDSSKDVPEDFGATFNPLTINQETLIRGVCEEFYADVTIGNDNPLMYVYHKAYQWVNNERWEEFDLECDLEKIDYSWCVGRASGIMEDIIASEESYMIAYTCQWNGSDWQCGCKDEVCDEKAWQLQIMQSYAPSIPEPPPTPAGP